GAFVPDSAPGLAPRQEPVTSRHRSSAGDAAAGRSLALVGFDDFELADLIVPGVTVVAQDPAEMGRIAAELLFRRLNGDRGPAQQVELATRLVQRGSGEISPGQVQPGSGPPQHNKKPRGLTHASEVAG